MISVDELDGSPGLTYGEGQTATPSVSAVAGLGLGIGDSSGSGRGSARRSTLTSFPLGPPSRTSLIPGPPKGPTGAAPILPLSTSSPPFRGPLHSSAGHGADVHVSSYPGGMGGGESRHEKETVGHRLSGGGSGSESDPTPRGSGPSGVSLQKLKGPVPDSDSEVSQASEETLPSPFRPLPHPTSPPDQPSDEELARRLHAEMNGTTRARKRRWAQ